MNKLRAWISNNRCPSDQMVFISFSSLVNLEVRIVLWKYQDLIAQALFAVYTWLLVINHDRACSICNIEIKWANAHKAIYWVASSAALGLAWLRCQGWQIKNNYRKTGFMYNKSKAFKSFFWVRNEINWKVGFLRGRQKIRIIVLTKLLLYMKFALVDENSDECTFSIVHKVYLE